MKKKEDDFLLYVADSSLVFTNDLKFREKEKIDIISRLPGRFGIEEELSSIFRDREVDLRTPEDPIPDIVV